MDIKKSAARSHDGRGEAMGYREDDALAPAVVPEDSVTTQRPRLSPENLAVIAIAMRESAARMDAVHGTDMMLALARLEGRPEDPLAAFVEYCGLPDMLEAQ